jgi:hypothetical protein
MGVFHTCKFSQRINREQKHEAGDKKVNDQRSRTSRGQRASRTNEQAGSYAPPNCNHLHMSAFELLLQFTVVAMFYVDRGRHPWLDCHTHLILLLLLKAHFAALFVFTFTRGCCV